MAFFGVTLLGYQNPIGDKLIVNLTEASHLRVTTLSTDGGDLRSGRPPCLQERQGPLRAPDQLYTMPLTDSQQYGWMMSRSPEPWTQVKRFPRKYCEMTKYVKEMLAADRERSLF
uniref:uncharacterized protein LOC120829553 isoform X5 n=1 Tax=Gasterosteus aculeatus aculeatus TaxID=481459 RepID=UPI001A99157F|nr:uncharacterized protein LOC120829553 isoform X5 [Gasterosteus aculeatus aculeatus]